MNKSEFFSSLHFTILKIATALFSIIIFSCNSASEKSEKKTPDLSKVKIGMSFTEVLDVAGLPDEKNNIGTVIDEFGHQSKTEEWHYGSNQVVVIINDTVNAVDTDIQNTYRKIQQIIDSARAAGDTTSMIRAVN